MSRYRETDAPGSGAKLSIPTTSVICSQWRSRRPGLQMTCKMGTWVLNSSTSAFIEVAMFLERFSKRFHMIVERFMSHKLCV